MPMPSASGRPIVTSSINSTDQGSTAVCTPNTPFTIQIMTGTTKIEATVAVTSSPMT